MEESKGLTMEQLLVALNTGTATQGMIEDLTSRTALIARATYASYNAKIEARLSRVTVLLSNIVVWLVMGCAGGFAVWGISIALDLILKAWGIR